MNLQPALLIKTFLVTTALLCLFTSCVNNNSGTTTNNEKSQNSSPLTCYRYINSADTITLKLIHIGKSITGTLSYKMLQKNISKGTIQGAMNGDLLVARFTPNGDSTIRREIVFKLIDNYFIEGYGEAYIENGQAFFRDRSNLSFNDTVKLKEFVCQ